MRCGSNVEGAPFFQREREENRAQTEEQVAADRARLRPDGLKRCRHCRQWLRLAAFNRFRAAPDGLAQGCRECNRAKLKMKLLKRARRHALELSLDPIMCAYCRTAEATDRAHIDPVLNGGQDDELNLLPACGSCNSSKWATPLDVWLPRRLGNLGQSPEWAGQLLDLLAREKVELAGDKARLRRQRDQQKRDRETLF